MEQEILNAEPWPVYETSYVFGDGTNLSGWLLPEMNWT